MIFIIGIRSWISCVTQILKMTYSVLTFKFDFLILYFLLSRFLKFQPHPHPCLRCRWSPTAFSPTTGVVVGRHVSPFHLFLKFLNSLLSISKLSSLSIFVSLARELDDGAAGSGVEPTHKRQRIKE